MTARVGGGGSPDRVARGLLTGGQGSKVYVLCAEPKEHKHFRPGTQPGGSCTRPGGSVTGVTDKLFMCQMFMCLFRLGKSGDFLFEVGWLPGFWIGCEDAIERGIATSPADAPGLPFLAFWDFSFFMSKAPDPLCSQKVWRKITLV